MLLEILESEDNGKYSFEYLRPLLSTYNENGYLIYRVLTNKIETRNSHERKLVTHIQNCVTKNYIIKIHNELKIDMENIILKFQTGCYIDRPILELLNNTKFLNIIKSKLCDDYEKKLRIKLNEICCSLNYPQISAGCEAALNAARINNNSKELEFYLSEVEHATRKNSQAIAGSSLLTNYADLIALYQLDKIFSSKWSCYKTA